MVLFLWSQNLPQILIFSLRSGPAEGEELCSVELPNVGARNAHHIVFDYFAS